MLCLTYAAKRLPLFRLATDVCQRQTLTVFAQVIVALLLQFPDKLKLKGKGQLNLGMQ